MGTNLWRKRVGDVVLLGLLLVSIPGSAFAQQGPVNPRIPPPPPPEEEIVLPPSQTRELPSITRAAIPAVPETVWLAGGTFIDVVLDTPLSTRISKDGQVVTFRSTRPIPLADGLTLPPETAFVGKVIKVKRPGSFGRAGELRVKVERIELPQGETTAIVARLDTPDRSHGRISADKNRAVDLYNIGLWTLNGTLLGASIGSGKGAGIGAGAGAAAALIILMSKRGPDVYLEPGMPFAIILDEPVSLSGRAVQAAQLDHERNYGTGSGGNGVGRDPENAVLDSERPKLRHRPKP